MLSSRIGMLAFMLLATLAVFSAERRVNETFGLASGGTLEMNLKGASVEIEAGSGDEVVLEAVVKGSASFVDNYNFTFEPSGDHLKIVSDSPKKSGWSISSKTVRVRVKVPARCVLDVRTSGGNITASAISGNHRLRTSGGNIDLARLEGDLEARTSGGNIYLEECNGEKLLKTSGGSVTVNESGGNLDAGTSGGTIKLRAVTGAVHARTSGGSIDIQLEGENQGITAHTSGGNIRLRMADDIGAEMAAKTSGGSVTCHLPIRTSGKIKPNKLYGSINGGGPEIRLSTSGGSIVIDNY